MLSITRALTNVATSRGVAASLRLVRVVPMSARIIGAGRRLLPATALLVLGACGPAAERPATLTWLVARPEPELDAQAPPEAMRWSLERLLSRGLTDRDSSGRVVLASAIDHDVTSGGLVHTFRLPDDLTFADGAPCASSDFRTALVAGLNRRDHGTKRWLLQAVLGVDNVRAGRALPTIGIETPDRGTLVIRLSRPDTLLMDKLALPGISAPWRWHDTTGTKPDWTQRVGVGPYRVVRHTEGRSMVLVRARRGGLPGFSGPDTIRVQFASVARLRRSLRAGTIDLAWPLPRGVSVVGESFEGYAWREWPTWPRRRLLLVMRADIYPTARLAARRALAHSLNRSELLRELGPGAGAVGALWPGTPEFDAPKLDAGEVTAWLARGRLGRSFHTRLTYDLDGIDRVIALRLQEGWARSDLSVELHPRRGAALRRAFLGGRDQLLLLEAQALLPGPVNELAGLTMPPGGAQVGPFRTGWRTPVFRPWTGLRKVSEPLDAAAAQDELERALVVLPIASLDWVAAVRGGARDVRFHPQFGPDPARRVTSGATLR